MEWVSLICWVASDVGRASQVVSLRALSRTRRWSPMWTRMGIWPSASLKREENGLRDYPPNRLSSTKIQESGFDSAFLVLHEATVLLMVVGCTTIGL